MTTIARLLRAEAPLLASAGIGRSIFDQEDPRLGSGIYEYADTEVAIAFYERGLRYRVDQEQREWMYAEIANIELMNLKQLVRLKGLYAVATIGVCTTDDVSQLRVPYVVYSSIANALERGVRELEGHAR